MIIRIGLFVVILAMSIFGGLHAWRNGWFTKNRRKEIKLNTVFGFLSVFLAILAILVLGMLE